MFGTTSLLLFSYSILKLPIDISSQSSNKMHLSTVATFCDVVGGVTLAYGLWILIFFAVVLELFFGRSGIDFVTTPEGVQVFSFLVGMGCVFSVVPFDISLYSGAIGP